MTHFEDGSPCDYFGLSEARLLAIGWLTSDYPHARGEVSTQFFQSLVELLAEPWQPVLFGGLQRCSFCRLTGGPSLSLIHI